MGLIRRNAVGQSDLFRSTGATEIYSFICALACREQYRDTAA
jgi:hypothetical protein